MLIRRRGPLSARRVYQSGVNKVVLRIKVRRRGGMRSRHQSFTENHAQA